MRARFLAILGMTTATIAATFFATSHADACAGLIGSNGNVNLGRTTTLAAYHNGEEHYVTSFEFTGTGGGEFGTLIPLPGIPTNIERGGDWTLQRLQLETTKVLRAPATGASYALEDAFGAEVLIEKRIDALDITILKGGGQDVAVWAEQHGFRLSPDAPEVLEFYSQRSPIFLAAVFDGAAAAERGQGAGDGTPVHLTIPTDNPWVPLRILGLGKQGSDRVEADVFLLTDAKPRILPGIREGIVRTHNAQATDLLLDDLRSDKGMEWVPETAWLTKLSIDARARDLDYDLAVDADGKDAPSAVAAGLEPPAEVAPATTTALADDDRSIGRSVIWLAVIAGGVLAIGIGLARFRPARFSK